MAKDTTGTPATTSKPKPKLGRERQTAIQRQKASKVVPEVALNDVKDRHMRPLLLLYHLQQPLRAMDITAALEMRGIPQTSHASNQYLSEINSLSKSLPKPIVDTRRTGRNTWYSLTDYGRELVSHQTYRWKDCPTRADFEALQAQLRKANMPRVEGGDAGAPEADEPDNSAELEDDDLVGADHEEQGVEPMSHPTAEKLDITEIADGLTARKFRDLVSRNPELQNALTKALGGTPQRATQAPAETEDDGMSMSATMNRSFKDMLNSFAQMNMWKLMMQMFGMNNSPVVPNPLNPSQVLSYPVQPQAPQASPMEQFMQFLKMSQEIQAKDTLTQKDVQDMLSRVQQQQQQSNELTALRTQIEQLGKQTNETVQQQQMEQIRNQIAEIGRNATLQKGEPVADMMQMMMGFLSKQGDADRGWQQQLEVIREAQRQKDAEYQNAQMEQIREQLRAALHEEKGGTGMKQRIEEAMEDIFLQKIRSAEDTGKDNDQRKLEILKDMVGTATTQVLAPVGSAIGEAVKLGVQERIARASAEQAGAPQQTFASAPPAPASILPAPHMTPAEGLPHPVPTSPPATTYPTQAAQPANPQATNPLAHISPMQAGITEGKPVPKPRDLLKNLP